MTGDFGSRDRRLHGLSDTMRAFAEATIDYQRLLRTVAERMAALLDSGCVLALVTEDLNSLVSGAVHFDDPVRMKAAVALLGIGPIPVTGSSLGARVIQTRTGILIPNVDEEVLRAALSEEYRHRIHDLGLRSLIVLPLEIRGRVLGVLVVCCRLGLRSRTPSTRRTKPSRAIWRSTPRSRSPTRSCSQSQKREIEDRKRAEEQAQAASKHWFNTAVNSSPWPRLEGRRCCS